MAGAMLGIVELAGQRRRAPAARAVAHHHDLFDLKLGDRKLERGGHAVVARLGLEWGRQVGDVADDENLARLDVENLGRIDAAVGAGDDHHARALTLGQLGPALALALPAVLAEAAVTVD